MGWTSSITRLIVGDRVAAFADAGVDQIGVEQSSAEDLGGALGLDRAGHRLAALLAAGQRQHRDVVSGGDVACENAAAADLDVVGVSPDREHDLEVLRAAHASPRDQLPCLVQQRPRVDRLGQVVVGSGADRRHRVLEAGAAGDDEGRDDRLGDLAVRR